MSAPAYLRSSAHATSTSSPSFHGHRRARSSAIGCGGRNQFRPRHLKGTEISFELVDHLVAYEVDRWVKATGIAGAGDPLLVLEALGQAADCLALLSSRREHRGLAVSIDQVEVQSAVRRGDRLELEARFTRPGPEFCVMSGEVSVGGQAVLRARDLMAVQVEADGLEDRASLEGRLDELLRKPGRRAALAPSPPDGGDLGSWLDLEGIEVDVGSGAQARGTVRQDLEVFATHFPLRPLV